MIHANFIRGIYLAFLNREPENVDIINSWIGSGFAEQDIVSEIGSSKESLILRYKSYLSSAAAQMPSNKSKFLIMQTSDRFRYAEMLRSSLTFNLKYANKFGWDYSVYFGIKKGMYPHHAALNRIFMLKELISQNHTGWVLYLDADFVITNHNFNIIENLDSSKVAYFFNHHHDFHVEYKWWYVNSGVFAINLAHPLAITLVEMWGFVYEHIYTERDYMAATKWADIINDQDSLHLCLLELAKHSSIERDILHGYLYDCFGHQFGRLEEDPSDGDIEARIKRIISAGENGVGIQE
jgi:hypothetical protein